MLLKQIAAWVKNRLGGRVGDLARETIRFSFTQSWFDQLFMDKSYLSAEDRKVLLGLAQLQSESVGLADYLTSRRVDAALLERLISIGLVSVLGGQGEESQIYLNSLLARYLKTDPRGFVQGSS